MTETYELSNKIFLTINHDCTDDICESSIIIGTLSSPKEEIDLTPEETKAMIEMLIDNNMYDPWMI